jgi:hypothetical protein
LGLTKTIKHRLICVYVPTERMAAEWKAEAKKRGLSVSRLVLELVDDELRKNSLGVTPREQLEVELDEAWRRIVALWSELDRLREENRRCQDAITEYRERLSMPVMVADESAEYVPMLAKLIQEEKVLDIQDALSRLGVQRQDTTSRQAVGAAADALESMGLIDKGMSDWRWKTGTRSEH